MALFVPRDRTSLFRQFLAGMYDSVVITDPNGHILTINERATEHFGYELDDVLDKPISVFVPRLEPEIVQRIRKGLEEDRHMMIDANGRTREGELLACEIAVSQVDLYNPGDIVFTLRNTERRRAVMNQLRAKANAFDLADEALFGSDMDGRIRDCNQAFLDMFDLKDVEAARKFTFAELMDDEPLVENYRKAQAGEATEIEISADGDEGECSLLVKLAPNMHGRKNHGVVGAIVRV